LPMLTLGIETSCDDTAAAVVRDGKEILSSIVGSQDDLHSPFGGVVPEMASRRHLEVIDAVVLAALDNAGARTQDLDLVAVTAGPGLIGSLLVGLSFAKGFCFATGLPLVPVDHIQGHLMTMDLAGGTPSPAVALVCSGGHTTLYHIDGSDAPPILGTALDDAAGEALDKASKMLGLGYPGGPAIEKAAENGNPEALKLPRPLAGSKTLDFSFSGLKTALYTLLKREGYFDPTATADRLPFPRSDIAASFQAAVVDVLVERSILALERLNLKDLVVVGGVARNALMRKRLEGMSREGGFNVHFPPFSLCTDNAAMVAALGYRRREMATTAPLTLNAYSTKALRAGRKHTEEPTA